MSPKTVTLLTAALLAGGYVHADPGQETELIRHPGPGRFNVCFNHGCQNLASVSLSAEQWRQIQAIFSAGIRSAPEERERIAMAIGKLESLVGRVTGTDGDKGGSLAGIWKRNQMDCVDESTNTHTYLVMLKNDGLLKHHVPADNARRVLPRIYQHYTAVIRETATDQKFAVDSWFKDNGRPPFIVPLSAWKRGWTPGDEIPKDLTPASSGTSG